ncbi:hypothetical protein OCU_06780 [Mycobacterium intracellulare ATCC 13950]|nr:hypothetical protein OCU_06780 [Mycobacterium intracellulare ATCC 13950]AFC52201.1 hypothetical protein OCQ_06880 [Mycobacterium paraintracellulare]AFS12814.1 Hypothetical protein MIP_01185 [Mycobacterium intracellulare subsp. intracellulare MTCC 9506]ARV84898.1 hypothetical protein BWK49_04150 [Mycobacterium intracellulare subsp. chimaera]ASW88048.1 hypothetical protein CKJ61_03425 [Mycobacterium intracellulare]
MPTVTSGVALAVTHVLPASEALMQTSACPCVVAARRRSCRRDGSCHPFSSRPCGGTKSSAVQAHATKPTSY